MRGRGSDHVAAVAAEVDVRRRDLPAPLLLTGRRSGSRRGARRRGCEPASPSDRASPSARARSNASNPLAAGVDVDVNDEDAGACSRSGGRCSRQGFAATTRGRRGRRGRVMEAVRGQRLLAAGDAGEDRDAEVGVARLRRRPGSVRRRRAASSRRSSAGSGSQGRTCRGDAPAGFPDSGIPVPVNLRGNQRFRRSTGIPKKFSVVLGDGTSGGLSICSEHGPTRKLANERQSAGPLEAAAEDLLVTISAASTRHPDGRASGWISCNVYSRRRPRTPTFMTGWMGKENRRPFEDGPERAVRQRHHRSVGLRAVDGTATRENTSAPAAPSPLADPLAGPGRQAAATLSAHRAPFRFWDTWADKTHRGQRRAGRRGSGLCQQPCLDIYGPTARRDGRLFLAGSLGLGR